MNANITPEPYVCLGCDCPRMNTLEWEGDRQWETIKGTGQDVKMMKLVCPECGCISYRCTYRNTPKSEQKEMFDGAEGEAKGSDPAD